MIQWWSTLKSTPLRQSRRDATLVGGAKFKIQTLPHARLKHAPPRSKPSTNTHIQYNHHCISEEPYSFASSFVWYFGIETNARRIQKIQQIAKIGTFCRAWRTRCAQDERTWREREKQLKNKTHVYTELFARARNYTSVCKLCAKNEQMKGWNERDGKGHDWVATRLRSKTIGNFTPNRHTSV